MKKRFLHRLTGIWIAALTAASLTLGGCSQAGSQTGTESVQTEKGTENSSEERKETEENTVFGKITAIEEDTITIALAEMPERPEGAPDGENPGERPEGEEGQEPPELPEGEEGQEPPEGEEGQEPPELPEGEEGQRPEDGNGENGPGQMELSLTGEEQTISVTESTVYSVNGEDASLEDLKVDDIVTVTLEEDQTAKEVRSGMGGGMGKKGDENAPGGAEEGSESQEAVDTPGANEVTDTQSLDGVLDSSTGDVSVAVVKDGGNLTLTDATVTKTGDTSNTENSEFYGLNAALLAKANSTMTITGTDITTEAEGANAVFATGEGASVSVEDVTIRTTGNSSRGLDATYGGSVTAKNVTVSTAGSHCAALATDRGEGTITVSDSSLQTSGEGSPCVYSTGEITVTDTSGTAKGSQTAVVEGKNSITLNNCEFTCAGKGRAEGGIDNAGVMIYQSMSGDAGEGTGSFTSSGSSLAIEEASENYETAPMFFVTNTDAKISLEDTDLVFGSGILLAAAGNDGEWGEKGSNGGIVTLNASRQTLEGDVTADEISTIGMNLAASTLKGAINGEKTAKAVTLNLDENSSWEMTGDSWVTVLTNGDTSCSNIISNGYTVYYDASNEGNSWLNGETISLSDGGSIAPAE